MSHPTPPVQKFESSEVVSTAEGLQYHIGCKPGDVAPYIILVGDPDRVAKVSKHFSSISVRRQNREYHTVTGVYEGIPLTVTSSGIGTDNTEIAVIELSQCVENPTFIRIGSCGALQEEINLGDLIISTGGVKIESTSDYFVPKGYPSVANYEVVLALVEAAARLQVPYHVGLTASACGFYGAQGRSVPGFPVRDPDLPKKLGTMGVKNYEMECSLLFTLAQLRGVRAGAVCAAFANRKQDAFVDSDLKYKAEAGCILAGLEAVKVLHKMDLAKGSAKHWRPSHGMQQKP